jgi:hypothetical protein
MTWRTKETVRERGKEGEGGEERITEEWRGRGIAGIFYI